MSISLIEAEKALHDAHLTPTRTRKLIYQYMCENHNHPTISDIYGDLTKKRTKLSKATVYNVLMLFTELGWVDTLDLGGEFRYQWHTKEPHGHFVCTQCGAIFNLDMYAFHYWKENLQEALHEVGVIKGESAYFTGICGECTAEGK